MMQKMANAVIQKKRDIQDFGAAFADGARLIKGLTTGTTLEDKDSSLVKRAEAHEGYAKADKAKNDAREATRNLRTG
jgi:hypothetical protein